jgi:hypothetical protein
LVSERALKSPKQWGKAVAQATSRAVGADTTAATATPQGWVAPALWRGTRSEEREYADDYSKRDSQVHNDIARSLFLYRNFAT